MNEAHEVTSTSLPSTLTVYVVGSSSASSWSFSINHRSQFVRIFCWFFNWFGIFHYLFSIILYFCLHFFLYRLFQLELVIEQVMLLLMQHRNRDSLCLLSFAGILSCGVGLFTLAIFISFLLVLTISIFHRIY